MAVNVQFGIDDATDVTVVSDTELTATTPAGTGTVDVTITTSGGDATLTDGFEYTEPPIVSTIDSAAPDTAVVNTQFTLTLTGTNLTRIATQGLWQWRRASDPDTATTYNLVGLAGTNTQVSGNVQVSDAAGPGEYVVAGVIGGEAVAISTDTITITAA